MKKDLLSNIASNTLTALGGLSGDANVTIAAAVLSPVAVAVTNDIVSRTLSSLQSDRLNRAFALILNKCKIRRDRGDIYREDAFMTENDGEQAKQVLEGILLNINNEYEKKKVEYHANLFTNICFEERLIFEQAIAVSRIIERMSYRQLTIIAYAYTQKNLKTRGWQARFKDFANLAKYGDFYSELFSLETMGILHQDCPGHALGGVPLKLSELGKIIYQEVDLSDIPVTDINIIGDIMEDINKIITGQ